MKEINPEHLRLLAIAFYKELEFLDPYNVGSPMLDCKRPFGNSSYESDILEIIGESPEDTEDDTPCYSQRQYDYARDLYTVHLTPYLKEQAKVHFKF